MADNGDDAGETGGDTGGFVFGEKRATDEESDAAGGALTAGPVVAAILLVAIVVAVVAVAAVVQPFGGDSGGAENTAPGAAAGVTTAANGTGSTEVGTVGTVGGPTPIDKNRTSQRTGASPAPPSTTTAPTAQPPPPTQTRTQTPTATQTASPTATATPTTTPTTTETTTDDTDQSETGRDGVETATATPDERSPVIETFTVTDRSGGATFDVAWNVTDPDSDLAAVTVTLVADPGGEARIIEQRRIDAGGARSVGNTTFEVSEGTVYAVRIEATDAAGNTAFSLTREVADGSSDE